MRELCARLLREETAEAGVDPFFAPVTRADRLALLLDRIDDLHLRRHDIGGRPAVLLADVIDRIDRLKDGLVTAADYAAWAEALPDGDDAERARAAREVEFARLYLDHDRLLAEVGALDAGELVLRAVALLRERPHVRARVAERYRHVLVDEYADLGFAAGAARRAARRRARAAHRLRRRRRRGAAHARGGDEERRATSSRRIPAPRSSASSARCAARSACSTPRARSSSRSPTASARRCTARPAAPCASGARPTSARRRRRSRPRSSGSCAAAARRSGSASLVRSLRDEGRQVALAFEERAIALRAVGEADFFAQAEVRDVLAWLRLLADPSDAGAVVRALARPPVALRSVDIARCVQIARRRKLDMVSALRAATESPQLPPEAREHIHAFLRLYREAAGTLDSARPDLFVHRLVDRLGLRRQQVFSAQADVVERLVNLARLGELASSYAQRAPHATPRDFARYAAAVADAGLREEDGAGAPPPPGAVQLMALDAAAGRELDWVFVLGLTSARMPGARLRAGETIPDALLKEALGPDDRAAHVAAMRRLLHVAMTRARARARARLPGARRRAASLQPPSPFAEEARAALGAEWEVLEEELFGPEEALHATFQALRDELLADVARVGKGLGELRLDTDLDVTHAVARYLELVKLAALHRAARRASRSPTRSGRSTQRLGRVALAAAARGARRPRRSTSCCSTPSATTAPARRRGRRAPSRRWRRSCRAAATASRCRRRTSRPTAPARCATSSRACCGCRRSRRSTSASGSSSTRCSSATTSRPVDSLDELLEPARLAAGGAAASATPTRSASCARKASAALRRYHQRVADEPVEPVWFERAFSFRMGAHTLRGRVDRVDRLADGGYELIDYKTGRPRSAAALREDVQLSLYAVGAREAWQLDATQQAYLYVLDDEKVRVPSAEIDAGWIADTVDEVARRHPRAGLRADAVLHGLLDVRLPDRLPGGGALTGIRRAMPVVFTDDPEGSRAFYEDFLGFTVGMEEPGFLMLQVAERADDAGHPRLGGSERDGPAGAPPRHARSRSPDFGAAHADAVARGLEIVYPLTDEPWGVRRFFVREPSGEGRQRRDATSPTSDDMAPDAATARPSACADVRLGRQLDADRVAGAHLAAGAARRP